MPVVEGELALEGYRYYQTIEQIKRWVQETSFDLLRDAVGDGYPTFWCAKRRQGSEKPPYTLSAVLSCQYGSLDV